MKKKDCQLVIAGSGGQGILYAGKLLAHSAMLEGRHVSWFPAYGAEIRGGTANCTVIIADDMIGSPSILNPDSLIIMNSTSMEKFVPKLQPGGIAILNNSLMRTNSPREDITLIRLNATDIANELGNIQVTNVVMLGAFVKITGIVRHDTVYTAMEQITPAHRKDTIPLNVQALRKGMAEIES